MALLKLPQPPLFSFEECLWFLDRGLDDVMHEVKGERVRKMVNFGNNPVLLEVRAGKNELLVELLKGEPENEQQVRDYMEDWFDLGRDLRPFYRLLKKDKDLAPLAERYKGLRIIGIPDLFEVICWCIIGQQIHLDFAYRIKRRLVEKYGKSISYKGKKYYLFPEPLSLVHLTPEDLKSMQMTGKKAEYIIGIAKLFLEGELSLTKLKRINDEKQLLTELVKVRGIGEWTGNYVIMKGLRAMNGVPYGDSGINNALFLLKGIPKKNNRAQVDEVFNQFEGWKTYLVFYLWRSLREREISNDKYKIVTKKIVKQ